jgi:hypothetical protein
MIRTFAKRPSGAKNMLTGPATYAGRTGRRSLEAKAPANASTFDKQTLTLQILRDAPNAIRPPPMPKNRSLRPMSSGYVYVSWNWYATS